MLDICNVCGRCRMTASSQTLVITSGLGAPFTRGGGVRNSELGSDFILGHVHPVCLLMIISLLQEPVPYVCLYVCKQLYVCI